MHFAAGDGVHGRARHHGVVAEALDPDRNVARRGHHVVREYSVDPFEATRVADIMAKPVDTLAAG